MKQGADEILGLGERGSEHAEGRQVVGTGADTEAMVEVVTCPIARPQRTLTLQHCKHNTIFAVNKLRHKLTIFLLFILRKSVC